jgi:tetratricopeptide (TPR) repeat protein
MTAEEVRALRLAGRHDEHVAAAAALAAERPTDALAQIEAAYGHDRRGDERAAISHYDAAYRLGVPAAERRKFLICYGSTMRNVGRAEDAVALLAQAASDYPDYPAAGAFLALALLSAGRPRAALAAMLGCALDAARPGALDGFERALTEYRQELLSPEAVRAP